MAVVGVGKSNRCVTGKRSRDNHAGLDLEIAENRESSEGHTADQRVRGISDDTACTGVQALAPTGFRKKIWDKKKSPL